MSYIKLEMFELEMFTITKDDQGIVRRLTKLRWYEKLKCLEKRALLITFPDFGEKTMEVVVK